MTPFWDVRELRLVLGAMVFVSAVIWLISRFG